MTRHDIPTSVRLGQTVNDDDPASAWVAPSAPCPAPYLSCSFPEPERPNWVNDGSMWLQCLAVLHEAETRPLIVGWMQVRGIS